jgi:hypothetical protein
MAMNKAEAKRLHDAEAALDAALALGWSKLPSPEPLPGYDPWAGLTERGEADGWTFNSHTRELSPMFRSGLSFYRGVTGDQVRAQPNRYSASRDGGPIYATRLDAAIALRLALEEDFAKKLAAIDTIINTEREA